MKLAHILIFQAVVALLVIVGYLANGWPIDWNMVAAAVLGMSVIVVVPINILYRIGVLGQAFRQGYLDGRTEGMTEAQTQAYLEKPPVTYRHHGKISFGIIVLIVLTLPISWPVLIFLILRSIVRHRGVQQELHIYEQSHLRAQEPDVVPAQHDSAR